MRSLLVLVAIMVSGCFGIGTSQLSEEEAHAVARDAIETFATDFSSRDGGQLRLVRGEFGAMGAGFRDAVFEAEWGRDGTARVEMTIGTGAASFQVGLHCDAQRTIVTYGQQRIEARPAPERSCLQALQEGSDPVALAQFGSLQVADVTPHKDGSVTATFGGDQNITAHIDAKGRLERFDLDKGGFLVAEYGQRRVMAMPEATSRMPALVFGAGFFDGSQYTWSAASAQEAVPFTEIEVRIQDANNQTAARFVPGPGQQEAGGFTFEFSDDGDGRFGAGDAFTVQHPAWTQEGQYEVLVWDVWADRAVGDVPIPAPALVLLAIALLAVVARR